MEKIVAEYSFWYIPLCLLVGMLYAFILYFRESKNEYSKRTRWILAFIRGIVVSSIAFLLLNPLIRSEKKTIEKPVVLVLQDNSESVLIGKDSTFYRTEYPELFGDFIESIAADFDVKSFTYGGTLADDAPVNFSAQETNTGKAFEAIYDRYSHKNVGAMVLLSDGINNQGMNPLYSNHNFNFPIYTVALGDTSLQRDLIIKRVNFNRIAYHENIFPLEINMLAKKSKGLTTVVTIERGGEVLFRNTVSFNSDNEFRTVEARLKAVETGLQKYKIRLSSVDGEISLDNNVMDIYIDVLEDKQKILMLSDAPHPDISAIKQSIGENVNYELEDFLISDFNAQLQSYNLVILHGLPSVKNNITSMLKRLEENNIPVLFILTKKTHLPLFNEQNTGLEIGLKGLIYNEALPSVNPDFNLFGVNDKTREAFGNFPPLICPYGSIRTSPSANPMLYQQIGSVSTTQPMWIFNQTLDRKTAVILGAGIWKWKLKEYSSSLSSAAFNDILNKTVQFLALRVDKSFFRVYGKTNYDENTDIEFEAELYNDVYELINDKDVAITLEGSDGTRYPFSFTQTANAYYLNAGNLPPDSYTYSSQVINGDKKITEKGEFTVSSTKLEKLNTQADHNLLFNLAQKYGGQMVYPGQMEKLVDEIKNREDIKPISYYQKSFSELLNLPLLLVLILLFLSTEWFIRKRAGGY